MRAALAIGLLGLAACGHDDVVSRDFGAACTGGGDCSASAMCLPAPEWPNGFCTQACESDGDCGSSALCILTSHQGTVCLYACNDSRDCEFLSSEGATWTCKDFFRFDGDAGTERACAGQ